ncbi:hypothetical protein [Nitrospirillum iridis]|uniref:Uncharacterized protein n=1 Tax=Nitrospirillum iridis TaxID=765888 RepID=A0A7X0AZ00_9PROT|nr:hypothetical protein [Nitrospirillum iridis]MBB6252347.1 hypothetical protein [Nitrospirillum iridis]
MTSPDTPPPPSDASANGVPADGQLPMAASPTPLFGQDPDGAAARMRHLFHMATAHQDSDCRALAGLLLKAATDLSAGDALAVETILARHPPDMRGWLLQRAAALATACGVVRHKIATPANLH